MSSTRELESALALQRSWSGDPGLRECASGSRSGHAALVNDSGYLMAVVLIALMMPVLAGHPAAQDDRIYFSDFYGDPDIPFFHGGFIRSSKLDGTAVDDVLSYITGTNNGGPAGIAIDDAAGKMYWTQYKLGFPNSCSIHRANLDGSNVEDLVENLPHSKGIELDLVEGKLYWAQSAGNAVMRSNLDGSQIEAVVNVAPKNPTDVAVDHFGGKVYWTEGGPSPHQLKRCNLNPLGSGVEILYTGPRPEGIDLDLAAGKIYVTDFTAGTVSRLNLNGSSVEGLVTGIPNLKGIVLDPPNDKMYFVNHSSFFKNANVWSANMDVDPSPQLLVGAPNQPLGGPFFLDLGPCPPVAAIEMSVLGMPPNPANSLLPGQTSAPVIGATWDPTIAPNFVTTVFNNTVPYFDALGIATAPLNLPLPSPGTKGTLLISPIALTGPLLLNFFPGTPFAVNIPNDCNLVGLQVFTQGFAVGFQGLSTVTALTNALDVSIGK